MATVREGKKAILMVVDVQVGVKEGRLGCPEIVENVARTAERARTHGVPVVWGSTLRRPTSQRHSEWQWVPEPVPADGETRRFKSFNSSFEETP